MPHPEELLRLSAELRSAYRLAWDEIQADQAKLLIDPRTIRRRAALRAMQERILVEMADLDRLAAEWLSRDFPSVYKLGATSAADALGTTWLWTKGDRQVLSLLVRDTFADLLSATNGVRESTKRLVRVLARDRALVGAIRGETAQQSAKKLAQLLERHGIHAITYRNGAKVGLSDYADMVIRTKTAVAANAAGINFSRREGVRFMECFDGFDCGLATHGDSEKPNGKVYPIETAAAFSLAHPRCQRSWSPRPDIMTAEQARRAEPSTTPEQRADQQASERRREEANRERARRRAAQRRAAARAGR